MQEFARVNFSLGSYRLLCELLSQNIAGNYSTIKLQAVITVTTGHVTWDRGNARIYNDNFTLGKTYYRGDNVVREITINVPHDNNGKGKIYIDGEIRTTYVFNGTCGGEITLPDIPRTANCISSPNITVDGKNTKHDLSFNNPGNFWLRIEYRWNDGAQIARNIGQVSHYNVSFTQDEIIRLYKRNDYVLRTITYADGNFGTLVGFNDQNGIATHKGIAKIYKNSKWNNAIFFVYKDSKWNIATVNIYKNGKWNGGK